MKNGASAKAVDLFFMAHSVEGKKYFVGLQAKRYHPENTLEPPRITKAFQNFFEMKVFDSFFFFYFKHSK